MTIEKKCILLRVDEDITVLCELVWEGTLTSRMCHGLINGPAVGAPRNSSSLTDTDSIQEMSLQAVTSVQMPIQKRQEVTRVLQVTQAVTSDV